MMSMDNIYKDLINKLEIQNKFRIKVIEYHLAKELNILWKKDLLDVTYNSGLYTFEYLINNLKYLYSRIKKNYALELLNGTNNLELEYDKSFKEKNEIKNKLLKEMNDYNIKIMNNILKKTKTNFYNYYLKNSNRNIKELEEELNNIYANNLLNENND